MKTLILAVAAVFALSSNAMAQDSNQGQREHKRLSNTEMAQMQTNRMSEQLGLDDTQKAALLKLNTEYTGKMHHGMGPMGGPRGQRMQNDTVKHERPTEAQMQEMRKQMDETRASYKAELKKILTEEQYAKYEEQEKQMFRMGGPQGGRGRMRGQGDQDAQQSQE